MGYQDRPYYRDQGSGWDHPILRFLSGSVPLFTAFGIHVRAHMSMLIFIVLVLLLGLGPEFTWQDRVQSMSMLFLIVLLHEFGHCFAARWVGGDADEIIMHPLGGLAMTRPPRQPLPTFITVAAGPSVNLLICMICAAVLFAIAGWMPSLNPWHVNPPQVRIEWFNVQRWAFWIYQVSYFLMLFNLLPIFPLDGGRILQTILWPKFGYYKSMLFSCNTGMVGAVIVGVFGLVYAFMLTVIALMGFFYCMQLKRQLVAMGPYEFQDTTDYSAAYETFRPKPRRRSRWAAKRAIKLARAEQAEQQRIDEILAKVSAHGMQSLTWFERRALKKATEHQRQRDLELQRLKGS